MRVILLLLLLVLTLDLFAQPNAATRSSESTFFQMVVENRVKVENENWLTDSLTFPPGIYYQFNRLTFSLNPELIMGYLFGKGVEIKEAWYRPSDNRCGVSEVMVSSSLLIRTTSKKKEQLLKKYGFVKTEEPNPGQCPYNVLHYVF